MNEFFMRILHRHLELYLTGIGLALCAAAFWGFYRVAGSAEAWRGTACLALVVGTLHNLLFWWFRQRRRFLQTIVIGQIEALLRDWSLTSSNEQGEPIGVAVSGAKQEHQKAHHIVRKVEVLLEALQLDLISRQQLEEFAENR